EFLSEYGVAAAHAGALDAAPIRAAVEQIERGFDPVYGGHRGAAKFPHCAEMELLLDLAEELRAPPHPTLSPDDKAVRGEGLESMAEPMLAPSPDDKAVRGEGLESMAEPTLAPSPDDKAVGGEGLRAWWN